MPAATLVSQNLQGTSPWVLKSHTHHPVSTEQNMDAAVSCMYPGHCTQKQMSAIVLQ